MLKVSMASHPLLHSESSSWTLDKLCCDIYLAESSLMLQQLHFNLGCVPFECAQDDNGFPPFKNSSLHPESGCIGAVRLKRSSMAAFGKHHNSRALPPSSTRIISPSSINPSLYLIIIRFNQYRLTLFDPCYASCGDLKELFQNKSIFYLSIDT